MKNLLSKAEPKQNNPLPLSKLKSAGYLVFLAVSQPVFHQRDPGGITSMIP
jgi:hypothetical protein